MSNDEIDIRATFTAEEQKELDRFFAAYSSDLKAANAHGDTLLHKAWNVVIAKYLVARGGEVDAKNQFGMTPLHLAAFTKDTEIVQFLISKGADVHAKSNSGETPLHWAANNRNTEVAAFLVSKGADVHAKNNDGQSPLHWAFWNVKIAEILISQGADVHVKDNSGKTPLDLAKEKRQTSVIEYLSGLTNGE